MISMRMSELANELNTSLYGKDVEFSGCSTDSRTLREGELFIALRGTYFDAHQFISEAKESGAVGVLVEREVDRSIPWIMVQDTRHTMGQIAGLWRSRFSPGVVGITGSNGKTTVKEMIYSILSKCASVLVTKGNLNNDIGVPMTMFNLNGKHKYAIIEMGANHPGEISWLSEIAKPRVAIITQCAPAHLEGFGDIIGVAKAKGEIVDALPDEGTAILNYDDQFHGLWQQVAGNRRCITFGKTGEADVYAAEILLGSRSTSFKLKTAKGRINIFLQLMGEHNVINALAAAAGAIALGVDLHDIKKGLESIEAVKGRLQWLQSPSGVQIVNDTYNANPGSLQAALNAMTNLSGPRWMILGDMEELGDEAVTIHEQAGRLIRNAGFDKLFACGELAIHAVDAFGDGGYHFESQNELITALLIEITAKTTLLVKGSRSSRMERVVELLIEKA